MLRDLKSLYGYTLKATDGEAGRVQDFLFNDRTWEIQFIVIRTGSPLTGRRILVAPSSLQRPDWATRSISVRLRIDQVNQSPDYTTHLPTSREQLETLNAYYEWLGYAAGGVLTTPPLVIPPILTQEEKHGAERPHTADSHLQSSREVAGYHIHGLDKSIGHVTDFILDDFAWRVSFVVVETRNWIRGKRVLISPTWITAIQWGERNVYIELNEDSIRKSPPFNPTSPINRVYEYRAYDYYGRPTNVAYHADQ